MLQKMKLRLDALSDAIIAIIITISVLDLPLPQTNDASSYIAFFQAIGIFLISFFIVANFWHQHSLIFNDVEKVSNRIISIDLAFLAALSLMPVFTRWLSVSMNQRDAVLSYGIYNLLVSIIFNFLFFEIMQLRQNDTAQNTKKIETKFMFHRFFLSILSSLIIIALSFFFPTIGAYFYIAFPLIRFFNNSFRDLTQRKPLNHEDMKQNKKHP